MNDRIKFHIGYIRIARVPPDLLDLVANVSMAAGSDDDITQVTRAHPCRNLV